MYSLRSGAAPSAPSGWSLADEKEIDFLKEIDQSKIVSGAEQITLAQALNMKSGIRIDRAEVNELRKEKDLLLGQGQIQAYLQYSAPIPRTKKTFKYQGSDPSVCLLYTSPSPRDATLSRMPACE